MPWPLKIVPIDFEALRTFKFSRHSCALFGLSVGLTGAAVVSKVVSKNVITTKYTLYIPKKY